MTVNTASTNLMPWSRSHAKADALHLFDASYQLSRYDTHIGRSDISDALIFFPKSSPTTLGNFVASNRRLDILLIGLDSRLGDRQGRADALHIVTIDIDDGTVTITGIPRGTYSNLGYEDDASNIIANVRSARGRQELLRRTATLINRDNIDYWVEIGFSDAFGIVEWLGFENPSAELRMLRRRTGYRYGDHTRCYTQAVFIRSAIRRLLPLLDGPGVDLLLEPGLDLVKSNLTAVQSRGLVALLNDLALTDTPERIHVVVHSPYNQNLAHDAANSTRMAWRNETTRWNDELATKRIRHSLAEAVEHERNAIAELLTMFRQHCWLQIDDRSERRILRDSIATVLSAFARAQGDSAVFEEIERTMRADDMLFSHGGRKTEHQE